MSYLIMAGQLILSLSILIVLHEMGHFFPARWFNTRVEKFYLFFDPWFSLFKVKRGETEYGIGWLPLGGYVKISGMIDESMDKEQMKQPPQPWEFRSKPAWQRLIIMLGGVTVNFILGFFIYAMVLFVWGEEYLPAQNASYGIAADSLGQALGFRDGDKVLALGDQPYDKFNDRLVFKAVAIDNVSSIKVERDGQQIMLMMPDSAAQMLTKRENKNERLFTPRAPFEIGRIAEGEEYAASQADIKVDDRVIAFNGQPTTYYHEYEKLALANKGKPVTLSLLRGKDTITTKLTLNEKGQMGVAPKPLAEYFDVKRQEYTFFEALPAGTAKGWDLLVTQIKAFGQMFRGKIKASESLGGFGTIAKMFGAQWVWENFWQMTAVLSLILAFMNLLPIPALDGGHVMFLLYEVVSGRKPSDKFMEYATIIGFIIVISLVLYANLLDAFRG